MDRELENFILNRYETKLLSNQRFGEIQKSMAEAYSNKDIDTYSDLSMELQTLVIWETYKYAIKDTFMFTLLV